MYTHLPEQTKKWKKKANYKHTETKDLTIKCLERWFEKHRNVEKSETATSLWQLSGFTVLLLSLPTFAFCFPAIFFLSLLFSCICFAQRLKLLFAIDLAKCRHKIVIRLGLLSA